MNILFFVASISFFISVFRNTLFWVALWQTKEYRLDRMVVHLRETVQGRRLFFSLFLFLKWMVILAYALVVLGFIPLLSYQIVVTIIFCYQASFFIKEIKEHLVRRPVNTIKVNSIVFLTVGTTFLLFLFPFVERFLWLLLIDIAISVFVIFYVFCFYYPTELYKDFVIEKAIKKIRARKDLLVIAVTGSYGKSSTKEYIAQILEKKFSVLKTSGSNNTPIGVASTIISGLKKNTQIIVVEMAAYKRGEISELCQITPPNIAVLTAVNQQHLSLFGNLKNTMLTKYELVESLPKNGLAVFNGNNKNASLLYQKTKRQNLERIMYKCSKIFDSLVDICAYNINVSKNSISFEVMFGNRTHHFVSPLLGEHNAEDILPGIYIANFLGMAVSEIKKAVSMLVAPAQTMSLRNVASGAAIVDDTFNSNPASVVAALNYMKIYKGKKFFVFQPMIELGKSRNADHYQMGKEISMICDYLFLTNRNFNREIMDGVREGGGKCLVYVSNALEIASFINKNTKKGDVIIFEGKEAHLALDKVI